MKVAFASGDCNSTNFAWKYDRTLKLYFKNPNQLSRVEEELAEGLAKIFSTQLELEKLSCKVNTSRCGDKSITSAN